MKKHMFKFWTMLSLLLLTGSLTQEVLATHYRYGNITWSRVPGGGDTVIKFKISEAWRRSAYGAPIVGSTVSTTAFFPGQGATVPVNLLVTSVNIAEDWFYGEYEFTKTFSSAPATYVAYTLESCCRISTLSNSADGNFKISTTVTIGNQNDAPVSSIPPFITFATATPTATYQIPYLDPNSDAVSFSMTPPNTFGVGATQAPGVSISPSGLITFNTVGKPINSLWTANFTMTDAKGATTQLDVILKVTNQSTPPFFNYGVTPANNSTITVTPGTPIAFNLQAADNDSGDVVDINGVGIPAGSTFNSVNGNPATASFSWTPTVANLGNFVLNFTAQDNNAAQATTIVNIVVTAAPSFYGSTPGNNSVFCHLPGATIAQTFEAQDADTTDAISLSVLSGADVDMSFTPNVPTALSNPVSTSMSWPTNAADWGLRTLVMRATDSYNESNDVTVNYIINNPPEITSLPSTTVIAGQPYSYTVTTADLDMAYGDQVGLETSSLPSFLTIVDNMDGTMTISGTPTIADAGPHNISIVVEDEMNHVLGTHCGTDVQTFVLEVVPCNASSSISVSPSPAIPNHNALTIYIGYGPQSLSLTANAMNMTAPITYTWSPAAGLSSTSDMSVNAAPTTTTTYMVEMVDANNCSTSSYVTINVIDARCGTSMDKVTVCHIPPDNPANVQEICISPNAVAAHLAHGCYVGPCSEVGGPSPSQFQRSAFIAEENHEQISIFPNPTEGSITVELPEKWMGGQVVVLDMNGKEMLRKAVNNRLLNIDITSFASGLYFVEVRNRKEVERFKLSKQ